MSRPECQLCGLPLGYRARGPVAAVDRKSTELRGDLVVRFGLASFLWLTIITLGLAFDFGYLQLFSESLRHYMPFLLLILAAPMVFCCGYPIHRQAWLGLRDVRPGVDSLVSLAVLGDYSFTVVRAFRGTSPDHFNSASAIVSLPGVRRYTEAQSFVIGCGSQAPGITPQLVSGDSRATTEAIARQLGMESYYSEVAPLQKADLIREWEKKTRGDCYGG